MKNLLLKIAFLTLLVTSNATWAETVYRCPTAEEIEKGNYKEKNWPRDPDSGSLPSKDTPELRLHAVALRPTLGNDEPTNQHVFFCKYAASGGPKGFIWYIPNLNLNNISKQFYSEKEFPKTCSIRKDGTKDDRDEQKTADECILIAS